MLTNISIKNFKSFSGTQSLDLAPITLIFGPNSSGKSTIIQSLLGMKQTLSTPQKQAGFIANGSCLDLNSFVSLIHGHDVGKEIELSFSFTYNLSAQEYQDIFSERQFLASSDIRKVGFTYAHKEKSEDDISSCFLKEFKYEISNSSDKENKLKLNIIKGDKNFTSELSENYYGDSATIRSLSSFILKRIERISDDNSSILNKMIIKSINKNIFKVNKNVSIPMTLHGETFSDFTNNYLGILSNEVSHEFNSIKYLGPLRTTPKRFYLSGKDNAVKMKGESNLGGELYESGSEVVKEINKWMKSFEIPYELSVKNFGSEISGDIISIVLKDERNDTLVTPMDVGFGIGQVLPIITDAIISRNNTLCVEQPEIHLHPRLQAHLADLFIDSVLAENKNKNGAQKTKNQWIIETHSESLILRMQRRIREKKINKELVKVYYVTAENEGSKIINLPLDDDGDFTAHWPHGFFDERVSEIFGG
ncbi:putative ATPase [Serratia sp. PL17]|uniref:DUF3696 domain-containing protein n=1 Tax=Serratia sp. PL17 TaxID=2806582 RepID=UPI001AE79B65|nr:DUF3696 domain-containing protein [Serratia sp. PL17]MBP1131655.1 putative ATPase [Serratia sp. PL17]